MDISINSRKKRVSQTAIVPHTLQPLKKNFNHNASNNNIISISQNNDNQSNNDMKSVDIRDEAMKGKLLNKNNEQTSSSDQSQSNSKQSSYKNSNQIGDSKSSKTSNSYLNIDLEERQQKRIELLYMAKLAEQIENFEEMVDYMKEIYNLIDKNFSDSYFNEDERMCLFSAYHNVISKRRIVLKAIHNFEYKERQKEHHIIETIKWYRIKIEDEFEQLCNEVIDIVDNQLETVNNSDPNDILAVVSFLKMKGDFNRYLIDQMEGDLKQKVLEDSQESYQQGWDMLSENKEIQNDQIQNKSISRTVKGSLLKIGMGLNFAVFQFEVRNNVQMAYKLAKETFEWYINDKEVGDLQDNQYKEFILPLQTLRENIKMWEEIIKQQDNEKEK